MGSCGEKEKKGIDIDDNVFNDDERSVLYNIYSPTIKAEQN